MAAGTAFKLNFRKIQVAIGLLGCLVPSWTILSATTDVGIHPNAAMF